MTEDETKGIKLPESSSPAGDTDDDWPTVRARVLAAARERADRTIRESRERRQAALEGHLEEYELARTIREAVDGPGVSMSVEEALGMLEGFGKPRH